MTRFRPVHILLIGLTLFFLNPHHAVQARGSTAAEVIQAINQRRQQRGLPPLQTHPILMSIAQQHSNYQASIGQGTHFGPDGSRPKDRAIAAGFGGGANVFISENWAAGLKMSIEEAITQHWDDYWHRHTMYNEKAEYIGVGVAYAGNTVYYTVDTGYWVGSPSSSSDNDQTSSLPTPAPQAAPVQKATPRPDGSLTHTVKPGQTLWTISAVYEIPIEDLEEQNGLTANHVLQPGEEIIIRTAPAMTTTPTQATPDSQTESPTPEPTKPTQTPTQSGSTGPGDTLSSPSPSPSKFKQTAKNPLMIVSAVVIAGGTIFISLMRGFIQAKRENHE